MSKKDEQPKEKDKRRGIFGGLGRRSASANATQDEDEAPMRRRSVTVNSLVPPSKEVVKGVSSPPNVHKMEKEKEKDKEKEKLSTFGRQRSLSRLSRALVAPKKRLSASTFEVDLVSSAKNVPLLDLLTSHHVTQGTASELIELLVEPSLVATKYRCDFFFALSYVIHPSALLERVWTGISAGGKFADKWMDVLMFWITDHFYYFTSSQPLMTALLQRISSATIDTKKLMEQISLKTQTLIVQKSNFRRPLDIQLLKSLLSQYLDKTIVEIEIPHLDAVAVLSKCPTLLVSINVDDDRARSDYFLKSESETVLKRLVEAAFLALNKTTNSYTLTSSGIAVFHDLTVEKSKSENLAALKALVNETVQGVGLKLRDCDDHGEAVPCLGGREIVDWLVKNSERVPVELRRVGNTVMNLDEKMALTIGKAMLDCGLIEDVTSGAFMMFSNTHWYKIPESEEKSTSLPRSQSESDLDNVPMSPSVSPPNTVRDQLGIESLNDADAATIACCLTAVDMEFLKNVDLTELDFTGWKKGAGQTITNWIAFFNRTSYLLATEIVTCPWPEERKSLVEKLVDVGAILLEKRNYQSLFSVLGGLTLNCVTRLSELWEKSLDGKHAQMWSALRHVTSSRNNFKEYRALIAKDEPNTVPYIGLLLQDILSIEEIPVYVTQDRKFESQETAGLELLNFERLKKLGINKAVLLQAQINTVIEDPCNSNLCEYLSSTGVALDRDTLYALSLKIQSRGNRTKKTRK